MTVKVKEETVVFSRTIRFRLEKLKVKVRLSPWTELLSTKLYFSSPVVYCRLDGITYRRVELLTPKKEEKST